MVISNSVALCCFDAYCDGLVKFLELYLTWKYYFCCRAVYGANNELKFLAVGDGNCSIGIKLFTKKLR